MEKFSILGLPSEFNSFYDENFRYLLDPKLYFVFGSNLKGIHGAGAAKIARFQYGAKLGIGEGFTGQSYAIPTKDEKIQTRDIVRVRESIQRFVDITRTGERCFYVTPVGCGLAGFQHKQIAPFFKEAKFCWFPSSWIKYLT